MLATLLQLALLLSCLPGSQQIASQQFRYAIIDTNIIPYLEELGLSNSLITNQNQYIDESQISINQTFHQRNDGDNSLIEYNILYFNLQNQQGRQCYYTYFSSNSSIFPNFTQKCQNKTITSASTENISCLNITNCTSEYFSYVIQIQEIEYKQNVIIIQNNHQSNSGDKLPLKLQMDSVINVHNSNQWFYISVALTCFLLISLVLLTGVVLYWSLNYRKAHRQLEELKLTQVDNQIGDLSSSIRKSFIKEE